MSGATVRRVGRSWIIHDPALIAAPEPQHFTPAHWREQVVGSASGRAAAVFIDCEAGRWVLRHYHRGGLPARLSRDRYLYTGREATRPFAEWRILAQARADGVAVPRPVAAAAHVSGATYHGDIIVERLVGAESLADRLASGRMAADDWQALAQAVATCHRRGYWHPDLNARNLIVAHGEWLLIDFDRARRRPPGAWGLANLLRLQRSLDKFCARGELSYAAGDWQRFISAYNDALKGH